MQTPVWKSLQQVIAHWTQSTSKIVQTIKLSQHAYRHQDEILIKYLIICLNYLSADNTY